MDEQPERPGGVSVATLTDAERRRVVIAGSLPVAGVLALLIGLAVAGRLPLVDVVLGTLVYGGLLGLTTGVVTHEWALSTHCPRCDAGGPRGRGSCGRCGYDLERRPVHVCELGHERAFEPGVCGCGRRLREVRPAAGLGRSVRRSLWAGLWLLAFLVGTGLLLRITG